MCHLWKWLNGALLWSEAGHKVYWFWSLLEGSLVQIKVNHCLYSSWGPLYELQSDLQVAGTCAGLEGAWERLSANRGWLQLVPGLGLLSKRYGACQGQMLLVQGL